MDNGWPSLSAPKIALPTQSRFMIYDSNLLSWTAPSRSLTHSHPYSAVRSPKEEATQPDRFTPHTGMSAHHYACVKCLVHKGMLFSFPYIVCLFVCLFVCFFTTLIRRTRLECYKDKEMFAIPHIFMYSHSQFFNNGEGTQSPSLLQCSADPDGRELPRTAGARKLPWTAGALPSSNRSDHLH